MARPQKRRATPEVPPSPAESCDLPQLRPASGGGRTPGEPARAVATSREIWLAIHLPHYVLESLRPRAAAAITVVVDLEGDGKVIRDCDAAAAAAGIAPGMALNSALALVPGLHVQARDTARERALVAAVAACALDFTPRVSLEPPDGVLLEVRGSLRLFGGSRRLVEQLRERLRSLGVEPRLGLAPTPLASLWFARSGQEVALRSRDGLASRLAPLPLGCTRWPDAVLQSLATMGVRTIGECLRLPRDGFARRFAPGRLRELDRAVGRVADPRAAFVRRERYTARRDLEPEIADTDRLARAIEPLLAGLCAHLGRRGCGVDALELALRHRDAPATRLRLRFVQPVSRPARIADLLRERLAQTVLPGPVRAVGLRSGPLLEAREEAGDLFARDQRRSSGVPQLVERLRARLGADVVHGLRLVPEHRPESAWKIGECHLFSAAAREQPGECHLSRPLWLLAEPRPLDGRDVPCHDGPLDLLEGPERIESGWWDGHDVRRDYYVARTAAGVRLWVFREREAEGRWFLHGVFG